MAKEEQPQKKVSRIKVKKKVWYRILAPKFFGEKEVGESYLTSPDAALGRKMEINLKDLTGNVRDQNAYVQFLISKVHGSTLNTTTIGYELTTSFVKRLVRKNAEKLDDYFELRTIDGKKIVVKTMMTTLNSAQRSAQTQLRKQLAAMLQQELAKSDFEMFISNIVSYKVQSEIKKKLSKITPVKDLAIRFVALMKEDGTKAQALEMPEAAPTLESVEELAAPELSQEA